MTLCSMSSDSTLPHFTALDRRSWQFATGPRSLSSRILPAHSATFFAQKNYKSQKCWVSTFLLDWLIGWFNFLLTNIFTRMTHIFFTVKSAYFPHFSRKSIFQYFSSCVESPRVPLFFKLNCCHAKTVRGTNRRPKYDVCGTSSLIEDFGLVL